MEIIAILKNRSEEKTFPSGFKVQEFYADNQQYNQNTGELYSNILKFQLIGDKTNLLNNFQKGQRIKIFFNIKGNEFTKDDGTKGHIQNLNVWKIETLQNTPTNDTPQTPTQDFMEDEDDDLPF